VATVVLVDTAVFLAILASQEFQDILVQAFLVIQVFLVIAGLADFLGIQESQVFQAIQASVVFQVFQVTLALAVIPGAEFLAILVYLVILVPAYQAFLELAGIRESLVTLEEVDIRALTVLMAQVGFQALVVTQEPMAQTERLAFLVSVE
jgi:hypothetical protein